MEKVNPQLKGELDKLLDCILLDGFDYLEFLSEVLHNNILNSRKVLLCPEITREDRDKIVYDISLQVLRNTINGQISLEAAIHAFRNILSFNDDEARAMGLLSERLAITAIFRQIQYTNSIQIAYNT